MMEYELAEDIKELVLKNDDVSIEPKLKKQLFEIDDDILVQIEKKIDKGIKIVDIKEVTPELLNNL